MKKEPYVKPAVISEILEPEALCCNGSYNYNPARCSIGTSFSTPSCCEDDVWPFW
jgi:hypothetical protein